MLLSDIHNIFFDLLQVAIGRRDALSRVPSAKDWSVLYGLSVKQAVAGVCFCGVQRLAVDQRSCLPASLKLQWFALATQIKARNELLNHRCVEVQHVVYKVRINCYYYRNYSFWKDIEMIFATVLGRKVKYMGEEI